MRGMSTYASVDISPPTTTKPVVMNVSQATRACGSLLRTASRTESEIWSAILSGCPSVTDSDVNEKERAAMPARLAAEAKREGRVLPVGLPPARPVSGGVDDAHHLVREIESRRELGAAAAEGGDSSGRGRDDELAADRRHVQRARPHRSGRGADELRERLARDLGVA